MAPVRDAASTPLIPAVDNRKLDTPAVLPQKPRAPDAYARDGRTAAPPSGPDWSRVLEHGKEPPAQLLTLAIETLVDVHLPAAERAAAGMAAAIMTVKCSGDATRAEIFYLTARELHAQSPAADHALLLILSERKNTDTALRLAEQLCARDPNDVFAWTERALLLIDDARPTESLKAAERAVEIARSRRLPAKVLNDALANLGEAAYRVRDPDRAVTVFREVLRLDPDHASAHNRIAELVIPDFDAPHRPRALALFAEANAAWQRTDWLGVVAQAREILKLDPNDGLAHRLFFLASERLRKSVYEGAKPKVEPFDNQETRRAAVRHFERLVARARVGKEKRPGKPTDFFPEWGVLTDLQKAAAAWSMLPYGRMLPTFIEMGARYHLALPGQPASDLDPKAVIGKRNSLGRYRYGVRGWQHSGFVVTGIEKLDNIVRGERNTIVHETAHVLHWVIRELAKRLRHDGASALTAEQRQLAEAASEIEELYAEVMAGQNGQQALDAYSMRNNREYFAQGMMAYLNPREADRESAPRLYDRNPKLWRLASQLARLTDDFPSLIPSVEHAPAGAAAVGTPLNLDELRRSGRTEELRRDAERLLAEISAFHLRPILQGTPEQLAAKQRSLLERAGALIGKNEAVA
jgi:tetratricopeptide (TPR) repeat protein